MAVRGCHVSGHPVHVPGRKKRKSQGEIEKRVFLGRLCFFPFEERNPLQRYVPTSHWLELRHTVTVSCKEDLGRNAKSVLRNCVGGCVDGSPSVVGSMRGFYLQKVGGLAEGEFSTGVGTER